MTVLNQIIEAKKDGLKLLAILLDPDKINVEDIKDIVKKIENFSADFIFVGGSSVKEGVTQKIVKALKKHTNTKIILFPGDVSQISPDADALLFMSLLSGQNPEYLINQQIKAVKKIKESYLEVIPTAYILIDGGNISSVEKISNTKPIPQNQKELVVNTALAGQFMGKQLAYLEAGSGALKPVGIRLIQQVSNELEIPLIVGGGIRSTHQIKAAFNSGANLVVVGTAFEENKLFLQAD